jgi:hypothetical protein
MNRLRLLLVFLLLNSMIAGCENGLQEGLPPEPVKSSQTPEYKDAMKAASGKMAMKKAPPGAVQKGKTP